MQTFGLNYEVKPDCIEEFKKTLADLIAEMKVCDGHVETILFADVTQPNSMMIYSNWDKKAEFAEFVKSDIFQDAITKATDMLESRPSHFAGQNIRLIKSPGATL
jgi:quinol monooxygenase YgiN